MNDSRKFLFIKYGNIFNSSKFSELEWRSEFSQAPNVILSGNIVRVYYTSRSKIFNGNYVSYPSFFEFGLNNPSKILYVHDKNILDCGLPGEFDEFGIYPFSVMKFNGEFIATYGGWTRLQSVPFDISIGLARSYDGIEFKKIGRGPILSKSLNEPFIIGSPKIRHYGNLFYLFYISGRKWIETDVRLEPIYKIRVATSTDLVNWEKNDLDIIVDKLGEFECQAAPDVIQINNIFYMFFSYRKHYDYMLNKNNSYRIGLAKSLDLKEWVRIDEDIIFGVSESGWDSLQVSYANMFLKDNLLYMLYAGNGVGKTGIGLAICDLNES